MTPMSLTDKAADWRRQRGAHTSRGDLDAIMGFWWLLLQNPMGLEPVAHADINSRGGQWGLKQMLGWHAIDG